MLPSLNFIVAMRITIVKIILCERSYIGYKYCAFYQTRMTSVFRINSLRHRYCKPTAHCNKSRDPIDLL